jgi:hypothetical protein
VSRSEIRGRIKGSGLSQFGWQWGAKDLDQAAGAAAGAVEVLEVALKFFVLLESIARTSHDGCGVMTGRNHDAVVHPLPFTPGGDDSGLSQVGKMPRNFGLRSADDLGKVTDAYFPLCH